MALPNPHGSSAGEIAHNSSYDTGNTPGSTGGKFIGFGEEGTSAIANRAAWALSENIDHCYQILTAEKAMPASYAFTGAGASFIQLAAGIGDIWVGDASYPGSAGTSDPEGMLMLFSVLDENYNELEDGNGNEIRVKEVRDNSNSADVYQSGFEVDPYIHFQSVDPITGAVVSSSYNIPGGTNVRIMCGEKGDLENMPADAFMRWKTHSMSEVQAGVFLQDGTRKMVGNIDADGNDLINAGNVQGAAASPLTVEALSGVLTLRAGTDLVLKDQNLASAVPISETNVIALSQPNSSYNPSIIGSLNSQIGVSEVFAPNRALNRTGSVSANNTPDFAHPALDVVLNGEQIRIAAGTVSVNDTNGTKYLYVDVTDATPKVADDPTTIPAGSIMIYRGEWTTGAPGSWGSEVDLRWPAATEGKTVTVFVGDGAGADFTSITEAVEVVNGLIPGASLSGHAPEMVIVGTAEASDTVDFGTQDWVVRGYGWGLSIIEPGASFSSANKDLLLSTSKVVIKDVEVRWNDNPSADQTDNVGAITLGSRSRIERVKFSQTGSYAFSNCIRVDNGVKGVIVEDCYADDAFTHSFFFAEAATHNRVSNCELKMRASADYVVLLAAFGALGADRNTFDGIVIDSTTERPQTAVFHVWGAGNVVKNSEFSFTGGGTCPLILTETINTTGPRNLGIAVKNCLLSGDTGYLYESAVADVAATERSEFINNQISSPTNDLFRCVVARSNASRLKVVGNVVTGGPLTGKYLAYLNGGGQFVAQDNTFTGHTGKGVEILANVAKVTLDDNWFDGWEDGDQLINVAATSTAKVSIKSNWFGSTNVSTNTDNRVITVAANGAQITDNVFSGSVTDSHWAIQLAAARAVVAGNQVLNYHRGYVALATTGVRNVIKENHFEGGVDETITVGSTTEVAANAIQFGGNSSGNVVSGNVFYDIDGRAIEVDGKANCVSNNVFQAVVGKYLFDAGGATESMALNGVIRVAATATQAVVSGNTISAYGFAATTETFEIRQSGVVDSGEHTTVTGNTVRAGTGSDLSATVDDYMHGFYKVAGHGVYMGNYVNQDLSSSAPYKTYSAYYLANTAIGDQTSWIGNVVQLSGTATGTLANGAMGFQGASTATAVLMGNIVSGTFSSGGTDYSYDWDCAGVALGNYAEQKDFILAGATCMQIGNVQDGADALTLSGAPSTTAYNANTATPRADLNQSL